MTANICVTFPTFSLRFVDFAVRFRCKLIPREATFEASLTVERIQREFPNAGYRRIHSYLKSRGVKVTHSRVREAMHIEETT